MTQTRMHVPLSQLPYDWAADGLLRRRVIAALDGECDENRWTLGPPVQQFEERFAEYIGVEHAIGVGSGTDALFLIMKALDIGPGDHVYTIPTTFPATVNAITHVGANPRFIDIGNDYLAKHATALGWFLPVHWGGDVSSWMTSWAGYRTIEDAAQAAGASIDGRMAGSFGIAGAFSLHPLKTLHVMGDGGVVTTNNEALADEIRLLRNHGLKDRNTCIRNGYNMRLHSIQAIVALHMLPYLYEWNELRILNAKRYDEGLRDVPGIEIPLREGRVKHVYHLYQFEVRYPGLEGAARDTLLAELRMRGIEATVHYPTPLHLHPAFMNLGYTRGSLPRAEQFADSHITLPVHQHLTEDQIDYVIENIRSIVGT